MQCTINGKPATLVPGTTVAAYLAAAGLAEAGLVVEINGVILAAGDWPTTVLGADDQIEIVSFVAGG